MEQNKETKQDVDADIEKAYPEAYRLARKFHELYEEVAPKFGYKTREDTTEFKPSSPNGKTMAHVCKTIVDEEVGIALTEQKKRIRIQIEELAGDPPLDSNDLRRGYHQMANDLLSSPELKVEE